MNIGFITSSYPADNSDLSGCFVREMALHFVRAGHQVRVVAPWRRPGLPPEKFPEHDLIPICWVTSPDWTHHLTHFGGMPDRIEENPTVLLGVPGLLYKMSQAAKSFLSRSQSIFAHWVLPSLLIAQWISGSRSVIPVGHSGDLYLLDRLPIILRTPLIRFMFNRIKNMTVTTHAQARMVSRWSGIPHGCRCHVLPMGVDLSSAFENSPADNPPAEYNKNTKKFTCLFVGRLESVKGVMTLIRACEIADCVLHIIGSGPKIDKVSQSGKRRPGAVRLFGALPPGEVGVHYNRCDVVCLPSRRQASGRTEGTPRVLLEALAAGKPVIASGVGGIVDVVRNYKEGLLVPPDNLELWVQALTFLKERRHIRCSMGRAARIRSTEYSWKVLAPRFLDLL